MSKAKGDFERKQAMAIRLLMLAFVLLTAVRTAHSVDETQYFALFLEGKKAGHAIHSRCESGGKVVTTQQVSLTAQRLGVPLTVNMKEEHIESKDGKPIGFGVVQDLGIVKMEVEGTVKETGLLEVKTKLMGAEQQVTLEWPRGAVMAEGLRLLQKKKGLKQGTQYSVSVFSAAMLQPIELEISIGGKRNVDLFGRVVPLTEVKTIQRLAAQPGALPTQELTGTQADTNSPAIEIIETSYVDSELHVQKHTSSVMGFEVEMIACTKEFALGENDVPELIDKMLLASPQPLDDISSIRSITYYLRPTDDSANLRIPSTDNQSVKRGEHDLVEVTVEPVPAPQAASFPYKGKDQTVLAAMKPTRFLQSDREQIIKLAREAIGDTKDAGQAVRQIEDFVAQYIDNKGLSVGYASAAEVAAARQGDCTEFAVLTAAMCRAVGIPAQVVMGMAYLEDFGGLKDRFGGHAWVQAYVGDRWVGLDAAFKSTGRGGYDPGHIALAIGDGNPEDFFNLVGTFGKFRIERLVVKRNNN
jgi:hypothetical protein